jgi:hypothetical protein
MSKYSIFATKQDYQNAYSILESLEKELGVELKWQKIKRTDLDNLTFLISCLQKQKYKDILQTKK